MCGEGPTTAYGLAMRAIDAQSVMQAQITMIMRVITLQ